MGMVTPQLTADEMAKVLHDALYVDGYKAKTAVRRAVILQGKSATVPLLGERYKGKNAELKNCLTHLAACSGGKRPEDGNSRHEYGITAFSACGLGVDSLGDVFGVGSEAELQERPTCPTCAKVWDLKHSK